MDHKHQYVDILRSHQYVDRQTFWEESFPEKSLKYIKVMDIKRKSKFQQRLDNVIVESNKIKEEKYGIKNNIMTNEEAYDILIQHQNWRLGNVDEAIYTPKQITKAINIVITLLEENFRFKRNNYDIEKEYEILKFCDLSNNNVFTPSFHLNGSYIDSIDNRKRNEDFFLKNNHKYEPYSIKRLSDGTIFTVGDYVESTTDTRKFKIGGFKQKTHYPNKLLVISEYGGTININKIEHRKPILITEDDKVIYWGDTLYFLRVKDGREYEPLYTYGKFEWDKHKRNSSKSGTYKWFSNKENILHYLKGVKGYVQKYSLDDIEKTYDLIFGESISDFNKNCFFDYLRNK